jgi:3-oxoacyl-[acyl-carrier protein] reductase
MVARHEYSVSMPLHDDDDSATRTVLITGASRGIGRATAVAFAATGYRVAVHFSSASAAAEETLAALDGTGHVVVSCDLSSTRP